MARQQTIGDVDLAQFFQVFQACHADLFARAFKNAGAAAKAMFSVIGDRMIEQNLPDVFDTEQWLVGNEADYFRIRIQLEERLCVLLHIFSDEEPIGLKDHFHGKAGMSDTLVPKLCLGTPMSGQLCCLRRNRVSKTSALIRALPSAPFRLRPSRTASRGLDSQNRVWERGR